MCDNLVNSNCRHTKLFIIPGPLFRFKDISSLQIAKVKFTYTLISVDRHLHSKVLEEKIVIKSLSKTISFISLAAVVSMASSCTG